jgi:hypothetical protein
MSRKRGSLRRTSKIGKTLMYGMLRSRIAADGGIRPLWARDGRELFYRNGDATMGVTINPSPSILTVPI